MFEDLFEEKKDQQKDTSKTSLFGGLFGAEEKVPVQPAGERIEEISAYTGPDIKRDREEEPLWRKAAKWALPGKVEGWLGLDKPMQEVGIKEDVEKRYENAYAYEDLKELRKQVEVGEGRLPEKTAGEVFGKLEKEPEILFPFVSVVPTIKETINLKKSLNKIKNGEEDFTDIYLVAKYGLEANRDSTFGAKVSEVLVQLPSFAGELLLTGGIYTAGKKVTEKIIGKTLTKYLGKKAGGLATRGIGTLIGGTIQTVPARFMEITSGTLQNLLPEFELTLDQSNQMSVLVGDTKDNVWEATIKSFGNEWVEVVSEHSGGLFTEIAAPIKSRMMKFAILKSFLKLNPAAKADDFMALVKRAGWNGFLPEIGEERVGEGLRALIGLEKYKLPTREQLAVELVAFSVPGVTIGAIQKSLGEVDLIKKEEKPEAPEKPKITPEVKPAPEITPEPQKAIPEQVSTEKGIISREIAMDMIPGNLSQITDEKRVLSKAHTILKNNGIELDEASFNDRVKEIVAGLKEIEGRKERAEYFVSAIENSSFQKATKPVKKTILDSLNPTGSLFVDYTPQERATLELGKNITTLDKTSNKSADTLITIYRGSSETQKTIVSGDFITTNYRLAKDYAGLGNVLSKEVKMSDVLDDITEPLGEEYIYKPITQATKPIKEIKPVEEVKPITDLVGKKLKVEPGAFEGVPIVTPEGKPIEKPAKKEVKLKPGDIKVGDVIDIKGMTNMAGDVTIKAIEGNTINFIDSKGTTWLGMARSTVRDFINKGEWSIVSPIADLVGKKLTVEPGVFEGIPIVTPEGKPITQKEKVAVKEETRATEKVKEGKYSLDELRAMTREQLLKVATDNGIVIKSSSNKLDILTQIMLQKEMPNKPVEEVKPIADLEYKWWNDIKPTKKVQIESGEMIDATPITRKEADLLKDSMVEISGGRHIMAVLQVPVKGVADTTGLQGWYRLKGKEILAKEKPTQKEKVKEAVKKHIKPKVEEAAKFSEKNNVIQALPDKEKEAIKKYEKGEITAKELSKELVKPKELEPLAQEARKYKSVEELIKAKGSQIITPVYHGTNVDFTYFKGGKSGGSLGTILRGHYFTDTKESASMFGEKIKKAYIISKKPVVIDYQKSGLTYGEIQQELDSISKGFEPNEDLVYAVESGNLKNWDTVVLKNTDYEGKVPFTEYIVKNPKNIITQDFYTQATKQVKEVKPKVVEAVPEVKGKAILPKANLTAVAKQSIGKNNTLPILESFLVKNGKLIATDLEVGVSFNTDLKDGAYRVVGKETVTSDIPIEDFPIVPKVEGKMVGEILLSDLTNVIKRANLSISKGYVRPEIGGLLLEIKNNTMNVVSTDSFRLFRQTIPLKGKNANVKLLIPAVKLQKILSNIKEDSGVEIYDQGLKKGEEYGGMVHFRTKFGDITVRKIVGDYPEYKDIYPELNSKYVFDRKQLLTALKELKPFVDYTSNITLTYKDGKMNLFAENKGEKISKNITLNTKKQTINKVNSGSANDGILVMQIKAVEGPKAEQFEFNVNYLIDAMNALAEDRVLMYSPESLAEIPILFSVASKLTSKPELKGSANATIGKFREGEDVELGGMDKVRPIEFPELVELTRDLTGRVPEVSRRLRAALGKFYGSERGKIKLTPSIFKDEAQATRVLAHEIGHLIDYLPHKTLKRGNLLGSLLSLRDFLKSTYGTEGALDLKKLRDQATKEILSEENLTFADLRTGKLTEEVKDKIKKRYNELITGTGAIRDVEIRKELKEVTHYWRPYEENKVSASYRSYRNSSRELYADAISLLFNSPGTLERLAPKFYKGFFNGLDLKPDVKNAYFDIQEVLSHDRATLIALRRKRTKEMFDRAAYKAQELQEVEEKSRKLRLKDYWHRFTYSMKSINQPVYDKVNQAEREGKHIPDDENPKYLLSGQNYLSGEIKARFEESVQPVMDDLIKNEVDWQTFGEFLLYERVAEGDRSDFANPGGITKKDATERITTIKQNFGEERFNNLQKNADNFRKFLKGLSTEAFNAGMITPEMKETMDKNEKYSPFQVVEYMEKNVSWKVKPQVGTLKDINNPANSLLLKAISTIRAIETQKNRMATFNMLETNFPDEIKEAELQFSGKAQRPVDTRKEGMGMITYYKEGKLRGKYVDQYIAKSLEKDSISRNKALMTILSPISYLNQKMFRPLFVIYNPGWIPFNFIRDYMRFWKNTPNLSFIGAAKRYGQAYRAAKVRAFGMSKKESAQEIEAQNMIRQLQKEKVLSVTWNDMLAGQEVEDAQIRAAMEKMGLAESKKEIPSMYKPLVAILEKIKILPLIRGIREVGDLIETLPKVAGYLELKDKMQPEEMREFIRKNVGSPDFFERGFATAATNNIFLFSNAFIQAVTADVNIATNPSTRSGFWVKTAKTILTPKILMFAALMGVFGDDLKELFADVSEYDMTNYFVIPIGRDTNNEKTIYLRIPMDETSRLIGGVAWKIMRASSNDQNFGRDVMDIGSLFGGQLPGLSPAISVPLSAFNFATGQNPYDSFRGRMVLTDEQMAAGGMYALKPFLLWEFQQMGGNIFTKFYLGERTPEKKSSGEKFLQIPVISNIIGRFIRISDYGQLEKYREKLYEIRGEKARERIDEDKAVNDYVKKYQEGEGEIYELGNDLIIDILGHAISSKEEKTRATRIKKKFKISIERGKADPKINAMISAVGNDEKVTLMRVYKEIMSKNDFKDLTTELLKYKIISTNVLRDLNKPFQP